MQLSPVTRGYQTLGHTRRRSSPAGTTLIVGMPARWGVGGCWNSQRTASSGTRSTAYASRSRDWSAAGSVPVGTLRRPSGTWIPASMGGTQREDSFPEGMHDRRHPGAGFEPGTHGTHQPESRRIGELPPPASLVLDDRPPEGNRTDHRGGRPSGARAFEDVE